ncbi:MAG: LysR family transcriptional regulator [Alphaproteobacteria bacterium]|nr:LysR family transcriptional regulator [Alphaproteobacteria bacterium]
MDRIESLRIFSRVVQCGSFSKAASTLQIPRSSVSMAIQELEARVGARLLARTTRRVAPTQEGIVFYERCERLVGDYEEVEGLFRQSSSLPAGRLSVNVPGRMGRLIFAPALPDFLSHYPKIELEMGVTDRAVDLVHEGIDCAVRVGPLSDSSLVARKIGDIVLCNCSSPSYLRKHGAPQAIEDLDRHLAVGYASPTSGRIEEWEWVEGNDVRLRAITARLTVNNAEAYIACCLAGLGLIQIPLYDVRQHLDAGELVEVMPDLRAAPMPVHILYPHRRHLSRRLQVFVDWATALLRQHVA